MIGSGCHRKTAGSGEQDQQDIDSWMRAGRGNRHLWIHHRAADNLLLKIGAVFKRQQLRRERQV